MMDQLEGKKLKWWSERCQRGDAEACHSWAVYRADIQGHKAAAALELRSNCLDRGYALSCSSAASLMVQPGKDNSEALSLFERACEGGVSDACYGAAFMHQHARKYGLTTDLSKASALYEKACNEGEGRACFALGHMAGNDVEKALFYFEKGCFLNDLRSCNNAVYLLNKGEGGIVADPARIQRLKKIVVDSKRDRAAHQ